MATSHFAVELAGMVNGNLKIWRAQTLGLFPEEQTVSGKTGHSSIKIDEGRATQPLDDGGIHDGSVTFFCL